MPQFDPKTAKKVFDPSTAKPFDPSSAVVVDRATATQTPMQILSSNPELEAGVDQLKRGNVVGGLANVATGVATGGLRPISAGVEAIRQNVPVLGDIIANAFNLPSNLYSGALNLIQSGIDATGMPRSAQNLGLSEENAQALGGLTNVAGQTLGGTLLGAGALRGAKAISPMMEKVTPSIEPSYVQAKNKVAVNIERAIPRAEAQGGIRGQRVDVKTVVGDLREAIGSGIDKASQEAPSTQLHNKISAYKDNLRAQELEAVNRHPDVQVDLGASVIDKELTPKLLRQDPEAYNGLLELKQRFSGVEPLPEAFQTLDKLNEMSKPTYEAIDRGRGVARKLSDVEKRAVKSITDRLRENYFATMENYGEAGIPQIRLRRQAMMGIIDDIEKNKNNIDATPRGLWERLSSGEGGTTTRAAAHNTLLSILRKSPIDYLNKAIAELPKTVGYGGEASSGIKYTPPTIRGLLTRGRYQQEITGQPAPRDYSSQPFPTSVGLPENLTQLTQSAIVDALLRQNSAFVQPTRMNVTGNPVIKLPSFNRESPQVISQEMLGNVLRQQMQPAEQVAPQKIQQFRQEAPKAENRIEPVQQTGQTIPTSQTIGNLTREQLDILPAMTEGMGGSLFKRGDAAKAMSEVERIYKVSTDRERVMALMDLYNKNRANWNLPDNFGWRAIQEILDRLY